MDGVGRGGRMLVRVDALSVAVAWGATTAVAMAVATHEPGWRALLRLAAVVALAPTLNAGVARLVPGDLGARLHDAATTSSLAVVSGAVVIAAPTNTPPLSSVVIGAATTWGATTVLRSVYRARLATRRDPPPRRVLVVGDASAAIALALETRARPELGMSVCGVVGPPPAAAEAGVVPWLGTDVGSVDLALHDFTEVVEPTRSGRSRTMTRSRTAEVCSRALDAGLAVAMALVTLPIVAVAAFAIRLADGGPVLFTQERIGRGGRPFTIVKLRTMVVDAESRLDEVRDRNERVGGPLVKIPSDPRVTRVGRVLRSCSIDELPQLWNVVRGEMALVGPRPALPGEVAAFDFELLRRFSVRPGLTGLWQVEARDDPAFATYRALDLRYIERRSLGVDVAILAATPAEVIVRAVQRLRQHRSAAAASVPAIAAD